MKKTPLISEHRIIEGLRKIGKEINAKFEGSPEQPIVLIVLKGAFIFGADLTRHFNFLHHVSFVQASSYNGNVKDGPPQISGESLSFFGKDIIIIEDIIDSGETMEHLNRWCMEKGAVTITTVALVQKPNAKVISNHYLYLYEGDKFLYGYGMDNNDAERHYKEVFEL